MNARLGSVLRDRGFSLPFGNAPSGASSSRSGTSTPPTLSCLFRMEVQFGPSARHYSHAKASIESESIASEAAGSDVVLGFPPAPQPHRGPGSVPDPFDTPHRS